jgi:glucosamine-6-phosphate isomerase
MKVNVFDSYDEMSAATADFVLDNLKRRPDLLLCIASGDTPTGTLKNLVRESQSGKADFSQAHFVGLDEWVGMDKSINGSCQHYIYSHFFDPLKISKDKIAFFDATSSDLASECKAIDQFLEIHGPIDLLIVGVGVNGHIGLNEPGTSFNTKCHVSQLAESTKAGAKKYFDDLKVLQKGITLGITHLMNAKTIVVIANGSKKANTIQQIIEGPITEMVPGSILQKHPDCYFFLDSEASATLSR